MIGAAIGWREKFGAKFESRVVFKVSGRVEGRLCDTWRKWRDVAMSPLQGPRRQRRRWRRVERPDATLATCGGGGGQKLLIISCFGIFDDFSGFFEDSYGSFGIFEDFSRIFRDF